MYNMPSLDVGISARPPIEAGTYIVSAANQQVSFGLSILSRILPFQNQHFAISVVHYRWRRPLRSLGARPSNLSAGVEQDRSRVSA